MEMPTSTPTPTPTTTEVENIVRNNANTDVDSDVNINMKMDFQSEMNQICQQIKIIWYRFRSLLYLQYKSVNETYENINLLLVLSGHETTFYDTLIKASVQAFLFYRKTFEADKERPGSMKMRSTVKKPKFDNMRQTMKRGFKSMGDLMHLGADTDSDDDDASREEEQERLPSIVIQSEEGLKTSLVYGGVFACLASPLIYIGIIALLPLWMTMLVIFGPVFVVTILLGTLAIATMQSFDSSYREQYYQIHQTTKTQTRTDVRAS